MELKLLNKEELHDLFVQEMVYDFPKAELKPLSAMYRLLDRGVYDALAVEKDGEKVGYALVWLAKERGGALLDYFGVLRGKRSRGLGTEILHLLAQRYGQILCEAEAPVSDDPQENELRRRRIGFYLRNGLRQLNYDCALFGVHYNCLYLGPETDDSKVEAIHHAIYREYYSPEHYGRYVQFPLLPGEAVRPAAAWIEEEDDGTYPDHD